MNPHRPLSDAAVARLRAFADRRLTPDEVRDWLSTPMTAEEREDSFALIRWFRRRYPEPIDRLAYARRAYARWRRGYGSC